MGSQTGPEKFRIFKNVREWNDYVEKTIKITVSNPKGSMGIIVYMGNRIWACVINLKFISFFSNFWKWIKNILTRL